MELEKPIELLLFCVVAILFQQTATFTVLDSQKRMALWAFIVKASPELGGGRCVWPV